ncbi:HNH endonuclease signature motif containing protein [Halomicroarcula sp. GCM10025709]|uniref:HNH endonuclease signature motif containing protein n=1 Tax=Halomicroarcula sp. GCM10025709 TaxID=3252669 RepID=UPI0036086B5B
MEELYVKRELSIHDISDILSCSNETIGRWLDKHNIDTRASTREKTPAELQDSEWLREQYVDRNQSAEQIASAPGCASTTVRTWVDKHGLKRRSRSEALKSRALFEPARYDTDSEGYSRWRVFRDGQRYEVRVHRLLAVAEVGVDNLNGNHVHHKNGIPWDNRPSNIEVLTPEEHGRRHGGQVSGGESA